MSRDLTTGLVCLVASLTLFVLTLDLPGPSLLVPIGPGFYPRIVLGITALLSSVLVVQALLARRSATASDPQQPGSGPNFTLVLWSFVVFGVYAGLVPLLGFRIATALFMVAMQWLLDPPRGIKAWLVALAIALVTSLTTFHLFQDYLSVLLPRGRWTDF